jgi:Cdc6-like AAA superfamily ATPase
MRDVADHDEIRHHENPHGCITHQTFLDSYCEIKPSTHTGLAFRIGEGKPLRGEHYKTPWREAERPTPLEPRRDLTVDEAMEAAMQGRGLLVLGAPGTGKTHWVRGVVAALRQAGRRVDCIAKTHVAVHNLAVEGACTADYWVRKHVRAGGVHCHTLVIEEFTQINVQLWADLALCRMKGVSIIACGDFGQFGPVCESWAGCEVEEGALEHSAMLLEMCPNRLVLTENKRSDARLFALYTNLGDDLDAALARAKEQFPRTDRPAAYTLSMSHARRMAVNKAMNELAHTEANKVS